MLNLITVGVWAIQGIMAIVVLGLSVDLVKGQMIGDAPTTTKYGTFTGGFGLAVAIMGFASAFIDAIPALAIMAADALSGLLLLGGGIAFVIGLRGVTCDLPEDDIGLKTLSGNSLINGGTVKIGKVNTLHEDLTFSRLLDNCRKATADQAMHFVTFGFAVATIFLVFLVWKNGRGSRGGSHI
ncbi:hypothetical protein CH63R_02512 [Colletotrichum higginsianum IMI 349063]|uniref:MARVEL domain-containing protein n=2 Tax=Colletotrichum higginsianum (strain IMI 349063) TaxID=759273 RepID=A0A1B7YP07_COLHI|nr:hypothetical protein CH63R_02512 [Colletotrichum higginsianum IMI 349063]OBR13786.1 hypothetical protein CH63R_02512 [Colletotrichum higginsianum IMI 349063]